jgi:hypothetical protein
VLPTTVWTTKPNRFVYDFFSFHDVKYYAEFQDPADIPPIELNKTELTYMYRTDQPKFDDNYYENDLFDALAKSLKVNIYQVLIQKIQATNAIAWLIHNDSFRKTLEQAKYIDSKKHNTDNDYEYKGNQFVTNNLNMYSSTWDRNKTRLRGTFEMLDWVAKTLNKWIRVISIHNPNEKKDNTSIETLKSQATEIDQLANTNGNTEDPTTYFMSKNRSADTEWTWNAHYKEHNTSVEEVIRYGREEGNVPSLGDDYLLKNQKDILYLFYEKTSPLEQCFYCLKKCTKDEYDEYFKNFEQRQKDRQEAIQKEAAEQEQENAKKFPFVANVLFGKFYSMLNIITEEERGKLKNYYWPAPFEMLYSVELKYVLAKIMQEISEHKAKAALDLTTSNMLQRRILLHILMSLTGTRSKKQIWDDYQQSSQPERVDYIEEKCTLILQQEDGIISLCLNKIVQTSLTFLQQDAPTFKKYIRKEWKTPANQVHVSNLKNKIDLIKAFFQEIITEHPRMQHYGFERRSHQQRAIHY